MVGEDRRLTGRLTLTKREKEKPDKTRERLHKWLARMLAAYAKGYPNEEHLEASRQLHDLATDDPYTFWYFMEYVAASDVPADKLRGLGEFGLYNLLRKHPDEFDILVAALVRDDERIRHLIREVDQDRIAPDVWRKIEAGLRGEQIRDD